MDGDEERPGGIAVCDGATGDEEAVASGDVAPVPADGQPVERESAEDVTVVDAEAPDGAPEEAEASDEVASDEVASDETGSGEPVSAEPASLEPDAGEPAAAGASDGVEPDEQAPAEDSVPAEDGAPVTADLPGEPEAVAAEATPPTGRAQRLRPYLKQGAVALAAAGFVALGVGAFAWVVSSTASTNQRFVEAAQSQGHVVAPGEQETLVVSAARKICERRVAHDTDQERRATALSADEVAAVGSAFGADTRDFTTLALKTFCSS